MPSYDDYEAKYQELGSVHAVAKHYGVHRSSAYVQRARLNGITYHRDRGEIARVVIGAD